MGHLHCRYTGWFILILLKNNRPKLQRLNQEITEFSLENQYFRFTFGLFLAIQVVLVIGNLQGITERYYYPIYYHFGVLIGNDILASDAFF